jgi:hypothetical protein
MAHLEYNYRRAMWAMLSRCADNGIDSLGMKTQLFGSLVSPILNYCSEVWAPALLCGGGGQSRAERMMSNQQHALQFEFLRRIGGNLRKSVSRVVLLREFGCRPLAHQWFMSCVSLWNRVVRQRVQDPVDWLVLAMQECVDDGLLHSRGWFAQFLRLVRLLFGDDHALCATLGSGDWPLLDELAAGDAFDRFIFAGLLAPGSDPRTAASDRVVYCTYKQWFIATLRFPELGRSTAQWRSSFHDVGGLSKAHMFDLLRFRVGAHSLRNVTGRWERTARQMRVCERCVDNCVEDEFHVVFECSIYDSLREKYDDLFKQHPPERATPDSRTLAEFMNQDPRRVTAFIGDCMLKRSGGDLSSQVSDEDFMSAMAESDEMFYSVSEEEELFAP